MNATYLVHHGVKGQRWGVENGPPYPLSTEQKRDAGYITKSEKKLNKLEGKREKLNTKLRKAKDKNLKYMKKLQKATKRGGDATKLYRKQLKAAIKAETLQKKIDKTSKQIDNLVEDLKKKGYTVTDATLNQSIKDAKPSEEAMRMMWPEYGDSGKRGVGFDYGNYGSDGHDRYIKEHAKDYLDNAVKRDQFDLEFLETVQNDPVLRKGGNELVTEYKKFLKDPGGFRDKFYEEGSSYRRKLETENKDLIEKAERVGYRNLTDAEKEKLDSLGLD